ncbi:23766_t:CDS:2 [Cetraspora pellucida]|uniref:23766_t:CDS:1 n=1 Tax=Cetraspora pellucida TaxID=1433469 RepID=A0A9N9DD74_9GLOM|nr:23766_t:CDS:2 [Cetraspora pellucida]
MDSLSTSYSFLNFQGQYPVSLENQQDPYEGEAAGCVERAYQGVNQLQQDPYQEIYNPSEIYQGHQKTDYMNSSHLLVAPRGQTSDFTSIIGRANPVNFSTSSVWHLGLVLELEYGRLGHECNVLVSSKNQEQSQEIANLIFQLSNVEAQLRDVKAQLRDVNAQLRDSNALIAFFQKLFGSKFSLYYNRFLKYSQNSLPFPGRKRKEIACGVCKSRKKRCDGGDIGKKPCDHCSKNGEECSYLNRLR